MMNKERGRVPSVSSFSSIHHSSFILHHFPLMDLPKLRKLVSLDQADPLSRFALGQKLFEVAQGDAELVEAAEHLRFANAAAPEHLATYHTLGRVLLRLGQKDEARSVLEEGVR